MGAIGLMFYVQRSEVFADVVSDFGCFVLIKSCQANNSNVYFTDGDD